MYNVNNWATRGMQLYKKFKCDTADFKSFLWGQYKNLNFERSCASIEEQYRRTRKIVQSVVGYMSGRESAQGTGPSSLYCSKESVLYVHTK
jgi:hypothetical protein